MARMLGRWSAAGWYRQRRPGHAAARWRKRVEDREVADEITEALAERYAGELPDPGCLDEYERVLPGARDRLLRMRHLTGNWQILPPAYRPACKEGPLR